MSNYFVGIDIGCGGSKACIIDDQGKVIGYGFREHKITVSNGTWSETEPDEYWSNIYTVIKQIITSNNLNAKNIKGVSVSSAVPAIVMVDSEGNVINKAYNFLDNRATDVVRELREKIGAKRCLEISGFNIDEQSTVTSMLWEKKHRPDDYKRIFKVLSPDGYVTFRLCGRMVLNYSAAPFYGTVFDIRKKKFDLEICRELDIDPNLFPDVFPCEEVIGEITNEAASLTGLVAGTPVIAGTVDAFAGWLAGGAIEAGETQINLGTAAVLGVVTGKPTFIENIWNCVYPVNSRNNYVIFGSTPTGGFVLRYLRNNFSTYEQFIEKTSGYDSYELLNLEAARIEPGSDGLITLPHFAGARNPEYNRHARGVVFGWSMHHTKGHLVRSMMEGVALSTYRLYGTMKDNGIETKGTIVMNEGGAKSRLWRQIYTNVFGYPTAMLKNRTGAPYGNAILAGVSTGYLKDFSIAKEWAEYIDYMEPDLKIHKMYMDIYEVYNSIYFHLQDDFSNLARLHETYFI